MKLKNIKYLIGEGFKSSWTNRLMSLASIGVLVACMIIIGLALLIKQNVDLALGNLEQQNVIMVYMKDYSWALYSDERQTVNSEEQADDNGVRPSDYVIHNEEEGKALCDKIAALSNVESADFISGDEGLESIKQNMKEGQEEYFSFLDDNYGNPLSAGAKVTMKDMSKFGETLEEIKGIEGVDTIQSQGDLAEKITDIKNGIGIAGFWVIGILIAIALLIVSNTIRVTMYSRKLEIGIMKAVGATNAFIRLPFVVEGLLIGLISALVSEGALYFCYRIAVETISKTLGTSEVVTYGSMALTLLGVFVAIGVFAGLVGSTIMITKYLRREGSEFTAI